MELFWTRGNATCASQEIGLQSRLSSEFHLRVDWLTAWARPCASHVLDIVHNRIRYRLSIPHATAGPWSCGSCSGAPSWGNRAGVEQADVEPSPDGHPLTRREAAGWTHECGRWLKLSARAQAKYIHSCLLMMCSARDAKPTYHTLQYCTSGNPMHFVMANTSESSRPLKVLIVGAGNHIAPQ